MENVTEMTAEQEAEQRLADEIREEQKNRATQRKLHPALLGWLATRGNLFGVNARGDLQNAPERHPDVVLLKRLMPQSSLDTLVKMAWLCWRARQVRHFHPEHGSRLHVGADVMTWAQALHSADERDGAHDEAFQARTNYYADPNRNAQRREAQEAEEEALALTLMRLPSVRIRKAEVDIVPTDKQPSAQDKAQEKANRAKARREDAKA